MTDIRDPKRTLMGYKIERRGIHHRAGLRESKKVQIAECKQTAKGSFADIRG